MDIFEKDSPAAVFAALTAGAAMKFAANFIVSKAKKYRYVGKVGALWLYPFKSFKGIRLDSADCTPLGLEWRGLMDRHWTVATADGIYLTQRQEPTMALIEPSLKGNLIQLTAPGMEPIAFPAFPEPNEKNLNKVTVKTDTVPSIDLGDKVADWFCRYFKRKGLRLHYSAPSLEKRDCSKAKKNWVHPAKPGDLTAFSDYCGYMILSSESLVILNNKLTKSVPIDNFRANIIVDDCKAFAEDSWAGVKIGKSELRALDPCTRCILITVDQEKGVKDEKEEPLTTLKTFRCREPYGQKPCMGMNFTLDKPGTIKVGDPIYAIDA